MGLPDENQKDRSPVRQEDHSTGWRRRPTNGARHIGAPRLIEWIGDRGDAVTTDPFGEPAGDSFWPGLTVQELLFARTLCEIRLRDPPIGTLCLKLHHVLGIDPIVSDLVKKRAIMVGLAAGGEHLSGRRTTPSRRFYGGRSKANRRREMSHFEIILRSTYPRSPRASDI